MIHLPEGDTRLAVRQDTLHDWNSKYLIPTPEEALESSRTCGGCSIYWCGMSTLTPGVQRGGCAAGTNWRLVHQYMQEGDLLTAYKRLLETNWAAGLMPTCNADCQSNCSAGHNLAYPVGIQANEAALSEWARKKGLILPRRIPAPTGKRVLVVGGGIAGMTAAYYLRGEGDEVTVVDAAGEAFGLIATAVPFFKQDKSWIQLYLANLVKEGVKFQFHTRVGTGAMPLATVFRNFDAVVLAVGSHQYNPLGKIPGADRDWVCPAIQLLFDQNWEHNSAGQHPNPMRSEEFDIAVVVGAGETADDAVHTLRRLKPNVRILQLIRREMPDLSLPAPMWPIGQPHIFKVLGEDDKESEKMWDTSITSMEGSKDAGIVRLRAGKDTLDPLTGRIRVFYATGFSGPVQSGLLSQLTAYGLKLDEKGRLVVDDYLRSGVTSVPVFGAGDAVSGMTDFVKALALGREAAYGVERMFRGGSNILSLRHGGGHRS